MNVNLSSRDFFLTSFSSMYRGFKHHSTDADAYYQYCRYFSANILYFFSHYGEHETSAFNKMILHSNAVKYKVHNI